ncbi:MAG: hypothetical protein WCT04_02095 [Planctomycetota bacterium]
MPAIRFTRGEYWLLESAATLKLPITLLFDTEIDLALNKPGHGMNRRGITGALDALKKRGLIQFTRRNSSEIISSSTKALANPTEVYYELTPKGGKQWEAFAAPDWDVFLDTSQCYSKKKPVRCEIIGQNRERIQRYVDGLHYDQVFPDPKTIRWKTHRPWRPTYWKVLPIGYSIVFDATIGERISWDTMPMSYYNLSRPRWYRWD